MNYIYTKKHNLKLLFGTLFVIIFFVSCFKFLPRSVYASTSIPVGNFSSFSTLVGTHLYVFNSGSSNVSIIDTNTNTVVGSPITVRNQSTVATLVGTDLYVLNSGLPGSVFVIDTLTNTVRATILVGSSPFAMSLSGTDLYVVNSDDDTVSVVDTTTNTVSSTISLTTSPSSAILVGTDLYVINGNGDSSVSVIDTNTNTVIGSPITVGSGTNFFATLVGTDLYVLNTVDSISGSVSVIDTLTNTVVATIPVGRFPIYAALGGTHLYVVNSGTNTVSVIDTTTNTVSSTISLAGNPKFATIVGADLYVVYTDNSSTDGAVSIIDTNTDTILGVPPPTFTTATIGGSTLALTYDVALDARSTPAIGDFVVSDNGSPMSISGVTIAQKNVVLSLATPVTRCGDTFTISYTPGIKPIEYDGSNQATSLTDAGITCAIPTYTLTYSAGTNGTLTGTTSQTVNYGVDGSPVTAIPNSGYHFVNWSDESTQNPRTDSDVTENISVTANFAITPIVPPSSSTSSHSGGISVPVYPISTTAGQPLDFSITKQTGLVITLSLNGDKNTIKGYLVSTKPDFSDTQSIQSYTSNPTFTLPDTNSHTIYLKYYSSTGVWSQVIQHDTKGSTTSVTPMTFTRTLMLGMSGADVKALQIFLNSHGFILAPTGPGSSGYETKNFGVKTKIALTKFQKANSISPAIGFFGQITKKIVEKIELGN